jgi:DNA gyrase subunit A
VKAVIATRDFKEAEYLVLATRKGLVKKTRFQEYNTQLKADGIIAIRLRDDDALVDVLHSTGEEDIILVSRKGQAIRFHENQVRSMGRATSGVKGMGLRKDDEVISAGIADDELDMLVVTDQGYGKRTRIKDYPVKGRGGLGVKTVQLTQARGQLAGAMPVSEGMQVMLISNGGTVIRMPVDEIKRLGRSTQGVIVMRLRGDEQVSSIALVAESEEPVEGGETVTEPVPEGVEDSAGENGNLQ